MTVAKLALHQGNAIMTLANTYPTLQLVVAELVQNGLDSDAKNIHVVVNRRSRRIAVRDNGVGASPEKFHQALCSVNETLKERGRLGRFGLGLISPLGKCEKFTFISCAFPHRDSYIEWTLESEKIKAQGAQGGDIIVPERLRRDLTFGSATWWRTEVVLHNYTTDSVVSRLTPESLAQDIHDKYSTALCRNNTVVKLSFIDENGVESPPLKVRSGSFQGRPLGEVILGDDNIGKTIIRMYITKAKQRRESKININFGEIGDDFRFPFRTFATSTAAREENGVDKETMDALRSGAFEGEILSGTAKIAETRTAFRNDDGQTILCLHLIEWYEKYGKAHLRAAQHEKKNERYQRLGLESMANIESMLQLPECETLRNVLKSFRKGTVGAGHAKVRTEGKQEVTAIATSGGREHKPSSNGHHSESSGTPHKRKERKTHVPMSVQGPAGQHRLVAKGNSSGLQLAHEDMGDSGLWRLDRESGILTFNVTDPTWVQCDDRDTAIKALVEIVVLQALQLEAMPNKEFEAHMRLYSTEFTKLLPLWLHKTSVLTRRKLTKDDKD